MLFKTALAMIRHAGDFLASLSQTERILSQFPFDRAHRTIWEFEPLGAGNPRYGVPWPALTSAQRRLGRRLLHSGLGMAGLAKAESIRNVERIQYPKHGGHSYALWFYGEPSLREAWAWRFEGHHLSVTFTLYGELISNTPLFLGVSPTCVSDNSDNPHVPIGTRALAEEENLSRALWHSLDSAQRRRAAVMLPPMTARTPQVAHIEAAIPNGIRVGDLRPDQRDLVEGIVRTFVGNVAPELAAIRYHEIERAGFDDIFLDVATSDAHCEPRGHARPGGLYYRLQGPTFLFEYDDIQWGWQRSGHIHTVWRDFASDFGSAAIHLPTVQPAFGE